MYIAKVFHCLWETRDRYSIITLLASTPTTCLAASRFEHVQYTPVLPTNNDRLQVDSQQCKCIYVRSCAHEWTCQYSTEESYSYTSTSPKITHIFNLYTSTLYLPMVSKKKNSNTVTSEFSNFFTYHNFQSWVNQMT